MNHTMSFPRITADVISDYSDYFNFSINFLFNNLFINPFKRKERLMKKNNFRVSALFATVMLFCAMFVTGCVADSDEVIPGGSGEGNLYISIKTETLSGATRGVTITTDPTASSENYLGKSLICIFSSTGDLVQYKEINTLQLADQQMETFSGKPYAVGQKVAVVSNLPATIHAAIKAKLENNATTPYTLAMLQAEKLAIMDALNADVLTTTDADRRIPMYGEGEMAESEGNYYVSIPVKHSLVKVTLNQLVVDFGESSTRNAIFTPDQVFLTNVPDVANVSANEAIATLDFDAASDPNKMYQGDAAITYVTTAPTAGQAQYADADKKKVAVTAISGGTNVLGTDVMTSGLEDLSQANSNWTKQYYFYTLPNQLTGEDATSLVVSGTFDTVGDDSDESRVYYSVKLNGNGDDQLLPNKNYKVNMVIHGKGATDAYAVAADPTIVEAFVTAVDFEENGQNVILGGGATTYSAQGEIIKVGDILFADGTFKSQSEAAGYYNSGSGPMPIGIVFHVLNAAEQAAAQYNGKKALVMALKDAAVTKKWAATTENAGLTRLSLTAHDATDAPAAAAEASLRRTVASEMKNLTRAGNNGLLNWNAITDKTSDNAFKAVADFDADGDAAADGADKTWGTVATSGWYLPSIGELYKMTYSLGKLNTALMNTGGAWGNSDTDGDKTWNWTPWGMYYTNGATAGSQGVADIVRDNINSMLDACGAGTYDAFEGGLQGTTGGSSPSSVGYWSSSEWSGGYAFGLVFSSNGSLSFDRGAAKSSAYRVRPVLAF
jgi:hypothetical protein